MKLEDKKRMAAKAFAAFFIFMAAAGGLSRAAAAMTVPLADTGTYQEGRLNLNLTGTAVAEAKEETLVSLDKDQRILSVAKTGTQVEAGEVLLQYDPQYLQKSVEEKQAEVKKLELSLEQARIQGEPQKRVAASDSAARDLDLANQGLAQAQSDYDQAVNDSQNAQNQAQSDYDSSAAQAGQEKENAYSQAQDLANQAKELEAQGETEEAQSLYGEAETVRQEADQTYEEALAQAQAEYDAAVSQAQSSLSQAEEALESQFQSQAQAQNSYTSAQEEDAAAAANDQKTQEESSYNQQSIQVDLDQAKKELSRLEKIQQAKGQVTAPAEGVVTGMNVQTGGITDDSSYLLLGTGGLQIKGGLELQDLEKVEPEAPRAAAVQALRDGTYFGTWTLNAPPLSQADTVLGLRLNGARLGESEATVQLNGAGGAACFGAQTVVTVAAGSCLSLVSNGTAIFPQSATGTPLASMTIVSVSP